MPLWIILIFVFVAGVIGGVINALLSDNGFIQPKKVSINGANDAVVWRPGCLGNMLIGGVASTISWGLYGPFNREYIIGSGSTPNKFGLTLSALTGAIFIGIGGARWLSAEVDKKLLKAAASEAANKQPSPDASKKISLAPPASALNIAKNIGISRN